MRSLDDLKKADSENGTFLNKHQKIGIELFHDLDERMDRSEASQIEAYVKKSVLEINSGLDIIACGSYRRGKGKLVGIVYKSVLERGRTACRLWCLFLYF